MFKCPVYFKAFNSIYSLKNHLVYLFIFFPHSHSHGIIAFAVTPVPCRSVSTSGTSAGHICDAHVTIRKAGSWELITRGLQYEWTKRYYMTVAPWSRVLFGQDDSSSPTRKFSAFYRISSPNVGTTKPAHHIFPSQMPSSRIPLQHFFVKGTLIIPPCLRLVCQS